MWWRIRIMVWKEFVQISRDPRMLGVAVVLPIFMLLLYGYAINLDVRHIRFAVYDQDRTHASRELIGVFSHSGYFDQVATPSSYREAGALLDRGRARVVLVIPAGYARDLARGMTVPVQLLVDGSDSTTASTVISYIGPIVQQVSSRLVVQAMQRGGVPVATLTPIGARARYWYNPELRSAHYIIPGLIAVILMMLSALLTSVTVVRERERGTFESLIASPVRPLEVLLGKLIPYAVIAFGDVLLVMVLGQLVFHVPFRGSVGLAIGLSGLYVLAALGTGLLISTVAPNQQVAMIGAMSGTQLPAILLSGFIFPISSMPVVIQWFANLIPAKHFIIIMRAIYLKGSGLAHLWPPALYLLLLGVALVLISTLRFRKKLG